LLFDAGRRRIGIRPVAPMAPHAFKIVPHTADNYHRLSAAAFCHHHQIYFKGTLLFHHLLDFSNPPGKAQLHGKTRNVLKFDREFCDYWI
jgi:hypothetical protein